jgi:hypothetical protein
VTITNITTTGLSIAGAGAYATGTRLEVLLRNVGWIAVCVCLSDETGCEVVFEQEVGPTIPLAA